MLRRRLQAGAAAAEREAALTDRDVKPHNVIPWVAGPGAKLPPAPPLWARVDGAGRLEVLRASDVAWGADPVYLERLRTLGWFEAVDSAGRSR